MAITGTNIQNETFTTGGNTYNVFKRMTFQATPAAGAATVRVDVGTAANADRNNPTSARDVGRYLTHHNTRNSVRILEVAAVDGQSTQFDLTLERPFDVSDFRAFFDSAGNRFDEAIPAVADACSISIDMEDLFRVSQTNDIASDGTGTRSIEPEVTTNDNGGGTKATFENIGITTPSQYRCNDEVQLPAGCMLVMEEGTFRGDNLVEDFFTPDTKHNDSAQMRFGRIHPNWVSTESSTNPPEYYTSGGVVILDGSNDTGTTTGHSLQLVGSQYVTTNSSPVVFLRLYDDNSSNNYENEGLQRNHWIDTKIFGGVGIRVAGNKSFWRNVQYNEGAWRGINFRARGAVNIFGYIEEVAAYDSGALLYAYLTDSGATTTVAAPIVVNANEDNTYESGQDQACTVNIWHDGLTNSGSVNKILNLDDVNWSALRAIETAKSNSSDYEFMRLRNGSAGDINGSFLNIRSTLNVIALDSSGNSFDDTDSKGFIWTGANADQADRTYDLAEVSDGEFAAASVIMQRMQIGREFRLDDNPSSGSGTNNIRYVYEDTADDSNNQVAMVAIHARGYQPARTSLLLQDYGPKTYRPTLLEDTEHSDTALATIEAYDDLNSAARLYDYAAYVIYEYPQSCSADGSLDFFASKSGNVITLRSGDDMLFSNSAFDTSDADVNDDTLYYNDTLQQVHARIAADTSFDGEIVCSGGGSIRMTHTITNSLTTTADITFLSGTMEDGDTLANGDLTITTGTGSGDGIKLPNGTYTVTGGADLSDARIEGTDGTPDVTIIIENGTAPTSLGTGVTVMEDVKVTLQLNEDYVSSSLKLRWANAADLDSYGSATKKDEDSSDLTITEDDEADTVELSFRIPTGEGVFGYVSYEGYEHVFFRNQTTAETIDMDAIGSGAIDFDATYTGDDLTLDGLTPTVGSNVSGSAWTADTEDIHIVVPSGDNLDCGGPVSRHFIWRAMSDDKWADAVISNYVPNRFWSFTANAAIINFQTGDGTEGARMLGNFSKTSDSDTISFGTRVQNIDETDLRTTIAPANSLTEVRFAVNANGASGQEVENIVTNVLDSIHLTAENVERLGKLQTVNTD